MKILFFFSLLSFSLMGFAKISDCYKEVTQAGKNECMAYERDLAVGRVMMEVTESCAEKEEIKASKGGTIYPMLLDECMANQLNELVEQVEEK